MAPDYSRILPWVFALLIPLALYRRFRRTFGRQLLRPKRMIVRIAIFLLLAAALLTRRSRDFALAELGGALIGAALAFWGASRTRFATEDARRYYVPHTQTGIAVSLLFVARLVYRLAQTSGAPADGRRRGQHRARGGAAGSDAKPADGGNLLRVDRLLRVLLQLGAVEIAAHHGGGPGSPAGCRKLSA